MRQRLRIGQIALRRHIRRQLRRDDVNFAARFQRDVLFIRMKRHRHRRRQRPRSRRPDDGRNFLPRQRRINLRRIVEQPILHPHGGAGVVLIFDFGLGQRGLVVHAPVDGAQPLVDESVFVKRKERRQHDRLILRIHRGIRPVESSEHADALELGALQVEKFLRILAALGAHVGGLHLQLLAAQFLVDLDLDGQPVAIPPRHVRRVKPGHGLRLDDEILQALIHRRAHVDGPAGVGRPVVQNVAGRAFPGLPDALVNAHLLPAFQHFGLVLGQVGLHGEGSFRQVDGRFQFERHSVASPK